MTKTVFFKIVRNIALCGLIALTYVHQKVETVKTSFVIHKQQEELSLLLDQYRSLVYNLSRLESPKRVEDILCQNDITLTLPKVSRIRHITGANFDLAKRETEKPKISLLARLVDKLTIKAEAKDKL